MAALVDERRRRFATLMRPAPAPIYEFHVAALRDAGFREVGAICQHGADRILMAVR